MPEISVIEISLPLGSESTDIDSKAESLQIISASVINGLANSQNSSTISFLNVTSSTYARVTLNLSSVTPTGSPSSISITNGTEQYTIQVSNTTASKRIEFNSIPTAFLTSFTVLNSLGAPFPASGNSLFIIAM
jgi:hypothetical protein